MSEGDFDPKKVAVIAITFYPKWYSGKLKSIKHTDKVRGDLALEFAEKVTSLGCHLIVADGKSTKTFRNQLQSIPGVTLIKRKTRGSGEGKRAGIERVAKLAEVEAIVLSEPEKVSVITHCLKQIVEPILQGKADIVVPKREDDLFKSTYPKYMYESETEGNSIYNETLRANSLLPEKLHDMDMFFGPRAFRNEKNIVQLFKREYHFSGMSLLEKLYSPDTYSNVQFFPIINAIKKDLRVVSVEVPFRYPHLQKENEDVGRREEFIAKRNMQRVSILIDLMHFLSFLKKNKNSRVRVLQ
jgi:hypothetical protein